MGQTPSSPTPRDQIAESPSSVHAHSVENPTIMQPTSDPSNPASTSWSESQSDEPRSDQTLPLMSKASIEASLEASSKRSSKSSRSLGGLVRRAKSMLRPSVRRNSAAPFPSTSSAQSVDTRPSTEQEGVCTSPREVEPAADLPPLENIDSSDEGSD